MDAESESSEKCTGDVSRILANEKKTIGGANKVMTYADVVWTKL